LLSNDRATASERVNTDALSAFFSSAKTGPAAKKLTAQTSQIPINVLIGHTFAKPNLWQFKRLVMYEYLRKEISWC
jgi:hypothetical protein